MGFVLVCDAPRPTCPRVRPLPETLLSRSACRCQATDMFRPRGFAPPRRLTPHTGLGFIAPRSQMEFAAFQSGHSPPSPTEVDSVDKRRSFPQRGSHPSKNSPRRQPYRIAAAVALMMLGRVETG